MLDLGFEHCFFAGALFRSIGLYFCAGGVKCHLFVGEMLGFALLNPHIRVLLIGYLVVVTKYFNLHVRP